MNRTSKFIGSILIIIGVIFLLANLNIIDISFGFIISRFWPSLFLLLPGVFFHMGFFAGRNKNPGLLVPGGILLVLGSVFQINTLFGGWDILWPLYIFSVAFGLFELYVFGNREKGLLIPVGILTGLSVIFFMAFSLNELLGFNAMPFIFPAILIIIGIYVMRKGSKNDGKY